MAYGLITSWQVDGETIERVTDFVSLCSKITADGDCSRGWDGWMAPPTQWTWIWASSGRWWRTGNPGVLQFMSSQRVEHAWETEQ